MSQIKKPAVRSSGISTQSECPLAYSGPNFLQAQRIVSFTPENNRRSILRTYQFRRCYHQYRRSIVKKQKHLLFCNFTRSISKVNCYIMFPIRIQTIRCISNICCINIDGPCSVRIHNTGNLNTVNYGPDPVNFLIILNRSCQGNITTDVISVSYTGYGTFRRSQIHPGPKPDEGIFTAGNPEQGNQGKNKKITGWGFPCGHLVN